MSASEYRRLAAECLRIAENVGDPSRATLIHMAGAWLELAQQGEHSSVQQQQQQQQQQLQPKKNIPD